MDIENMRLTGTEFRHMLDWFMASDPFPLGSDGHAVIRDLLEVEADYRGYSTWIVAYHEFSHE